MWFSKLTGIEESSPEQVRSQLILQGNTLTSKVNGASWTCGTLEIPSLGDLREKVQRLELPAGELKLSEVVGDVGKLHTHLENGGAVFQVASQFNLLEMVSPNITPEQGIDGYENDRTQGPACAIACGAGTIYRNYFVPLGGQLGQTRDVQVDCLEDIGTALGNADGHLWEMRNGYALASKSGLLEIDQLLKHQSETERDELRKMLRIGIQWDTQVTRDDCGQLVTQVYGSALPVAYSQHSSDLWKEFARLVLEASYEATLCVGLLNAVVTKNQKVFLTLLGGGAFGNTDEWIFSAISRAISLFRDKSLDVAIVSYGSSRQNVRDWILQQKY